jgi:3-oxoacyl-[acyl-carrier protein] reductase
MKKYVLVTGASRGIGRAIAQRLSRDGFAVIAHYGASAAEAKSLQAELRAAGGTVEIVQADLATSDGVKQLYAGVDAVLVAAGAKTLFGVVNNAGIADWTPVREISDAAFDRLFNVNVKALYFSTLAAESRLSDGGRVVNVSSIVADTAFPDVMAYSATKGAVNTLTINFAKIFGPRGITVNSLSPGATRTDMSAWLNDPAGAANATSLQALKRVGESDDIADVASFLLSNDSRWVTGQTIAASGGWGLG